MNKYKLIIAGLLILLLVCIYNVIEAQHQLHEYQKATNALIDRVENDWYGFDDVTLESQEFDDWYKLDQEL